MIYEEPIFVKDSFDTGEIADLMNKAKRTIQRHLREGRIPDAYKYNGEWYVPKQSLYEYINDIKKVGDKTSLVQQTIKSVLYTSKRYNNRRLAH